ncbi:hypothetical protein [uncultured Shewanella sp.]|uniref:hypothetical protein n=1 Tax=uncultured Shewanella sp. TaxID=173975 RepID=UPI00262538F1|nr:hypothetical protein [uncultured Shewanella sp.]
MAKSDKTKAKTNAEGVSLTPYAEALIDYVSAFYGQNSQQAKTITPTARRAWAIDYLNRYAAPDWRIRGGKQEMANKRHTQDKDNQSCLTRSVPKQTHKQIHKFPLESK